ncbi:MAG: BLUF domain-containing protein [Rhodospirillales bacterium]|nr:BLUF domain-containing protein [Acetobacter sp.]
MIETPARTLFCLVYVSSAVGVFSSEDLVALLATSRRNNARDGVTGMLLYRQGNFMQVLEGEEEKVRAVHERIQGDSRHRGLITLLQQPIEARQFGGWSMGFRNLSDPSLQKTPGYSDFLNQPRRTDRFFGTPSRVQKLLRMFRQNM